MLYDPYATTNLGGVGSPAGGIPGAPGNLGGVGGPAPRGSIPAVSYTAQIDPQATMLDRVKSRVQNVTNMASNKGQRLTKAVQQNRNLLMSRGALLGGATVLATGALQSGIEEMQEGNAPGGLANIAATGGGLAAAAGIASRVTNPLAKAGVMAAGGLLAGGLGQVAEEGVGRITGKGKSQGAARTRNIKEAENQAEVQAILQGGQMGTYVAGINDIQQNAMNTRLEEFQRQIPLINQLQNAQLVRQQALNASNAQNYMQMGVVATAGKIAQQQVRESGANLRTAMQANPYAGSVLQAPNISF